MNEARDRIDAALVADAAGIAGLTALQIRARWMEVVSTDTAQRLSLERLATKLDDLEVLASIQSHAGAGERALAAGGSLDATQAACLDAVALMRTLGSYGRTSANFGKARHLARLTALVSVGVLIQTQADAILAEATSETTTTYRWQSLGLSRRPLVDDIQAGLDRSG